MKFETQKDIPLIPAGEQILKFVGVESKQMDDRYGRSKDGSGKVTRTIWKFISQLTDEDGVPYEYAVFTGTSYGNERATLTLLLDMLVPGMTVEKSVTFDSDDLIGKKFLARIKHAKRDDGKGLKAVHTYIAPVGSPPTKNEYAPDYDSSDPFNV